MKKWLDNPHYISSLMEHVMALLVLIGIVIATVSLSSSLIEYWHHRQMEGAFLEYIEKIFNIVIGIEFFKLLWKPGKETLLEVLMFVLARHMIINHTTALENLLSVVAIAVLFVVERYLLHHHVLPFGKGDENVAEEKHEKTYTIFDE